MNEAKHPDNLYDSDCADVHRTEVQPGSNAEDGCQDNLTGSHEEHEILALTLAYENFFKCTPMQQIWVLRNCPEKLFLKSENPINIRKHARNWQTEIERMYALELSMARIFAGTNPKVKK